MKPAKAAPAPITPLDLDQLARDHAKVGTLWTRPAKFDFAHIQVTAAVLVTDDDGQPKALRFCLYNGCLSLKQQKELDPADAVPVADAGDLLTKLERQGYRVHTPPAASTEAPAAEPEPAPKRRGGRPRKATA